MVILFIAFHLQADEDLLFAIGQYKGRTGNKRTDFIHKEEKNKRREKKKMKIFCFLFCKIFDQFSRFDFVFNGKYEKQLQNEILSQRDTVCLTDSSNQLFPFNVSIDEIDADEAVGN